MTCETCRAPITPLYAGRGPRRYCDECRVARRRAADARRQRERRESPAYKAKYRADSLRRLYGLTVEAFDALLASQGGGCAICSRRDPGWRKDWHVDHDHETGVVRGLLCQSCNLLLGMAKDDPERLAAAIAYLKPPGWKKPSMVEAVL